MGKLIKCAISLGARYYPEDGEGWQPYRISWGGGGIEGVARFSCDDEDEACCLVLIQVLRRLLDMLRLAGEEPLNLALEVEVDSRGMFRQLKNPRARRRPLRLRHRRARALLAGFGRALLIPSWDKGNRTPCRERPVAA